jgi:hypothetical protein
MHACVRLSGTVQHHEGMLRGTICNLPSSRGVVSFVFSCSAVLVSCVDVTTISVLFIRSVECTVAAPAPPFDEVYSASTALGVSLECPWSALEGSCNRMSTYDCLKVKCVGVRCR